MLNPTATERTVVSTILAFGSDAIQQAVQRGLVADHFSDGSCQAVYRAMVMLYSASKPVSQELVWECMAKGKFGTTPGDFVEATSLPMGTTVGLAELIDDVIDGATRRGLIVKATELIEAANTGDQSDLARKVAKLIESTSRGKARDMGDILARGKERVANIISGQWNPEQGALEWPIAIADASLKKVRRGELVIVAARPGVGKSSMARQFTVHNAKLGKRCLFFTLEVGVDDVLDQMATAMAGTNYRNLPSASTDNKARVVKALEDLSTYDLHLYECDSSLAEIVARCKAAHASKPVDLVVIDYLGLIKDCNAISKNSNKAQAVEAVTGALKRLARELGCVVLCLAQLNRAAAAEGRKPNLSDLRDSGGIEQDADRVVFIHRLEEQSKTQAFAEPPITIEVALIQDKGRNVGLGYCGARFHCPTASFSGPKDNLTDHAF
jgi:replicative DNA helicase